jgi:hypothetical protein
MLGITRVRIAPNLPGIGKDLDARATLNADVIAAEPDLLAFTIMAFTPNANPALHGSMVRAAVGDITGVAVVVGILAQDSYEDVDSAGAPINRPSMIYRAGTFIRSTVNEVMGGYTPPLAPILPGDEMDRALNLKGIYLEESWDESGG